MTVINTNVKSLIAQNAIKLNSRDMAKAMNQLATGNRINSASDDAAGLAVSQSLTAQIRGLNMAVRNANDGISLAQTAEGAMVEISEMLQRMRELAVQAATGTLSDSQREYLATEFDALDTQMQNTVSNTQWNGKLVLTSGATSTSFTIQTGMDKDQTIVIESKSISLAPAADISRATGAATTIAQVDTALGQVNLARATLGAVINRLNNVGDNLTNIAQNVSESRSRVLDTDYAAATTELARTQIIAQAGMAVLAQANQQPQTVLSLLR